LHSRIEFVSFFVKLIY